MQMRFPLSHLQKSNQGRLQIAYYVKYQVFLLVAEEVEDYHHHQMNHE